MLASIATIAGAITALAGLVWYGIDQIKKAKAKSRIENRRKAESELMEAVTDEERARLAKVISDLRAK